MVIKSIKITKSQRSSKIITIEIVIYYHFLIKNTEIKWKNKKIKNKKEDKKSTFWNVKLKTNMKKFI